MLGADVVVHSATKFLGGHHDLIGGVVLSNDALLAEKIRFIQQTSGTMLSPFDCFLLDRSLKTFAIRLEKQCKNADMLASFLESHPRIDFVRFPGLKSHPQHEIAKKQMSSFGALITIRIKGEDIDEFFSHLKIAQISQSLGGFGTIIQVPARMIRLSNSAQELKEIGIDKNLIRISVGLENIDDLKDDFAQALDALKE
jgi:cystathionine beta-lyase/cystathionine gamma-synthase